MSDDNYRVGYGKPPINGRFLPGISGNPSGRPRRARNFNQLIELELRKIVAGTDAGRTVRLSKLQLIVSRTVNDAAKGDSKAREFLYKYHLIDAPTDFVAHRSDEGIIRELAASIIDDCDERAGA